MLKQTTFIFLLLLFLTGCESNDIEKASSFLGDLAEWISLLEEDKSSTDLNQSVVN